MKPTKERLLNAGFEIRKEDIGVGWHKKHIKDTELFIHTWMNLDHSSLVHNNIELLKFDFTEERLNEIYKVFTGETLNFEPQPKSAYKGHEERIKELEEKVEELIRINKNI